MGRFRHFRKNVTVSDVAGRAKMTFTVKQARRFLIEADCMNRAQQREHAAEIAEATRVVKKADNRNARRRRNRRGASTPRSTDCSSIDTQIDVSCSANAKPRDLSLECLEILQERKKLCNGEGGSLRSSEPSLESQEAKYEETFGPEGEIIRFKLHYDKEGNFVKRTRTRLEPQVGDIVLDLTSGLRAWRITRNRRRKHPVTPSMRASYENSYIYKARKLAAGRYATSNAENLKRFLEDVKDADSGRFKSRKSKKLKKRKKRKK